MKVRLKNVGMLDEAEFEVGDLTIICGENNTGKTYATYSLYGYLDFINGNNSRFAILGIIEHIIKQFGSLVDFRDEYTIKITINNMQTIIGSLFDTIISTYNNNLEEILAGNIEDFKNSIFKIDTKDMILDILKNIKDGVNKQVIIDFFGYSSEFTLSNIIDEYFEFNYEKGKNHFLEKMQQDLEFRKQRFIFVLFSYITFSMYPRAFILSAERTGASMFQKELDVNKNEIVDRISKVNTKNMQEIVADVFNNRYSRYPKPVKDNIYFIRELDMASKKISFIKSAESLPLHKEIVEILYKIVGGKYVVSETSIEFAPGAKQRITKGKFAIQRASSSVRSLLMLNYYVLNVAQKGDILMIDEPELNLHPSNQILMGRLIALLVNAGIKVFITTHSDYIVRELSNCIMLNNLSCEQINKLHKKGYTKEHKLESSKVKAYIADKVRGKNTLKPIKVDSKQGIFMDTFDEPINSQNENQSLIFEEIIKAKNDK
ncbi:AAA family ATPase [Helicobacter sp. T3_23-1056]